MANTKHIMVRMPPELHAEIEAVAKMLDVSIAQAIRASIRRWVKDPSLEEVRPSSSRGPCVCIQGTDGLGGVTSRIAPHCPQHGVSADA